MASKLNNLSFNHCEEWPMVIKVITAVVVFLAIIFLGYLLVGSGKADKLKREQQYFTELQQQYTRYYRKFRKFRQIEINMESKQASLKAIINKLPTSNKTYEINSAIQAAANKNKIRILSFRALSTEEHEYYSITPLQIKAQTSYHQAALFLSEIANLPQIIIIEDFALKKAADSQQATLNFTATLNLYQPKDTKDA